MLVDKTQDRDIISYFNGGMLQLMSGKTSGRSLARAVYSRRLDRGKKSA
jgi:hypothetical protein